MADRSTDDGQPLVSSTTSTTTSGPHTTTTTTSYPAGPGHVTTHGPSSTTITHPTITTTTHVPLSPSQALHTHTRISQPQSQAPSQHQAVQPQVPASTAAPITRTRTGSIRIRRPSSGRDIPIAAPAPAAHPLQTIPQAQPPLVSPRPTPVKENSWQGQGNRRRSSSEPQRPPVALLEAEHELRHHPTATMPLQPLYEDESQTGANVGAGPPPTRGDSKRKRPGMNRMTSAINLRRRDHQQRDHEIDNDMVDMLDVIGRYYYCSLKIFTKLLQIRRFLH